MTNQKQKTNGRTHTHIPTEEKHEKGQESKQQNLNVEYKCSFFTFKKLQNH